MLNRWMLLLPLVLALIGCGGRDASPASKKSAATAARGAEDNFVLMQAHSLLGDPAHHRRTIDLMKEAGVQMIRDEVYWHLVEAEKGTFKIPDNARKNIDYTISQEIKILLILDYANPHYDEDMAPHTPEGRAAYARYCEFMARELHGKIDHFEIWNEPNVDGFWKPVANAKDYAALLKEAYPAVKRGNPDAFVLGGGLSMVDMKFTEAVFAEGTHDSMDAWSVHPYITPRSPAQAGVWKQLADVQAITAKHGKPLPIWVTETGYPTHSDGVTEEFQADMIARMYIGSFADPVNDVMGWYWFGPDGPDGDLNEDRFGLIASDRSKKPSFHALKTFTGLISAGRHTGSPKISDQVIAHSFQNDREFVTVAWSLEGIRQLRARVSGTATLVTRDGQRLEMLPEEGEVYFDVSSSPVYLVSDAPVELSLVTEPTISLAQPMTLTGNEPGRIAFSSGWEPLEGPKDRRKYLVLKLTRAWWDARDDFELVSTDVTDKVTNPTYMAYAIRPMAKARRGLHELALNVAMRGEEKPFARLLQQVTVAPGATVRVEPLEPVRFRCTVLPPAQEADRKLEYRVVVRLSSEEEGVRFLPEQFEYVGPLNADGFSREIAITSQHPLDAVFHVKATAELGSGEVVQGSTPISFMQSPRAPGRLAMDGDLSDWPAVAPIRLNRRNQLVSEWRKWEGEEDGSARVYTCWDGDRFYVAAEVKDNDISAPVKGFNLYRNDGLEFYVDAQFAEDRAQQSYSDDDNQFGFFNEEERSVIFRWSHLGNYYQGGELNINRSPTPSQTISGEPCAYIIEGWVSAADLKLKPRAGMMIGFNCALADDDDPRTIHPFGQEVQLIWSGLRNSYRNPHKFAQLFLVEKMEEQE